MCGRLGVRVRFMLVTTMAVRMPFMGMIVRVTAVVMGAVVMPVRM